MLGSLITIWLEGVYIIVCFLPFLICLIVLTASLILFLDLITAVIFSNLNDGKLNFAITESLLPKEIYDKVWKWFNME